MSSSLLDAAGIALLGVVAAMATSTMSGDPLPSIIEDLLLRVGLSTTNLTNSAVTLGIFAGVLLICKSLLSILLTRGVLRFLATRQAAISGQLAAKLLSRPLVQVQERSSQETAFALTTGVNAATLGVLGQTTTGLAELSLLGVLALGLLALDPVVAIFTAAFFLVIAVILQRLISTRAHRLGETSSNAEIASTVLVQESLSAYREILVSNRRHLYVDEFQGLRWKSASVQANLSMVSLIPKYVFEIALIVGAGLLAWSQFIMKDASSAIATIAVFLAAGSRIVPSMLRLQSSLLGVRVSAGMAAPTIQLAHELSFMGAESPALDSRDKFTGEELAIKIQMGHTGFTPSLELIDVSFRYPNEKIFSLENINISVTQGMSVALVGPTGAGKSTLADMILGVINPEKGIVKISGSPPLEAISTWPGSMAYVPQEVAMSLGSIRKNVALGVPQEFIDDALVWDALTRAHLSDFLRESRQGLDTIIGEHGMRLSGGQRQRLGIARALYTRPKLLVLDEATSALDSETEHAIVDTLKELEGAVTTVTIAHRLATVRHCDIIIYLERGKIIAQGSFDDVVKEAPNFARQARLLGLN